MAQPASSPLKTIAAQRRYQQVADQIAALIDKGVWAVGAQLPPERDLAQQLGVSRPTVREAMVALDLAGLIDVRTGAGTFVRARPQLGQTTSVSIHDDPGPSPFEILDARELVEGETAARAAQQATDRDLLSLQDAIATMRGDIERGVQGLDRTDDGDWQFHVRLAGATGNQVLTDLVSELWSAMRRPMFLAVSARAGLADFARSAASEHEVITGCIAARDPAGARQAMHAHIRSVRAVLLAADEGT